MKGLWVAAGSCSGWLGTDSPPSSKRALNEACPRAQLPREQLAWSSSWWLWADTFRWAGMGWERKGLVGNRMYPVRKVSQWRGMARKL